MRSQFFSVGSDNLKSEIAECLFAIVRLEVLGAKFDSETISHKDPAHFTRVARIALAYPGAECKRLAVLVYRAR